MGLFDLFKSNNTNSSKKPNKKKDPVLYAFDLYLDAKELEEQGLLDEAEKKYAEAAKYNPREYTGYIEFLKQREKWEKIVQEGERAYAKHGGKAVYFMLKTLAECYRYGKGTPKNRDLACKHMDTYQLFADKSERTSCIQFKIECVKEFLKDMDSFNGLSTDDLADLKYAKVKHINYDALEAKGGVKESAIRTKWKLRLSDYERELEEAKSLS